MNGNEDTANIDREYTYRSDRAAEKTQVIRFADLARGAKEVVVEYEKQHYRLRVTKNGKLILNK